MSDVGSGGYHWRDAERVARWTEQPVSDARQQGLHAITDHVPGPPGTPFNFVDLGAGDGRVSEVILTRFPEATGDLVDFSEPMIERGKQRLEPFAGRIRYRYWDMNAGDWPEGLPGPFLAVVSAAALHHLDNERKRWLFGEVSARLQPGGVFATWDLFRNPLATLGVEEVHARTCASVDEAEAFLAEAGFRDVATTGRRPRADRKAELAVMSGIRP